MAKVPTPDRGQPLDVSYIYGLAKAVNDLYDQTVQATYKYAKIDTVKNGPQSKMITDTKIIAGYVGVADNKDVVANEQIPFSYKWSDYAYAPIVTATPVNLTGTSAGTDVVVVINSITTGGVDGVVKFATAGKVSVGINLIAIGIPN